MFLGNETLRNRNPDTPSIKNGRTLFLPVVATFVLVVLIIVEASKQKIKRDYKNK